MTGSQPRRNLWIDRAVIFIIALVVRVVIAYIYLGSVDLLASIDNSVLMFGGGQTDLPYFPMVSLFIWFGGLLNVCTDLPLAFCYKIFPIVFDVFIATLIYDFLISRGRRLAFMSGLLYALSPVSIFIICIHSQWDSPALFFILLSFYIREYYRGSKYSMLLFGVYFGLSIMTKPVYMLLLPLFFRPCDRKHEDVQKMPMIYALPITLVIIPIIFTASGGSLYGMIPLLLLGVLLGFLIVKSIDVYNEIDIQSTFHSIRKQIVGVIGLAAVAVLAIVISEYYDYSVLRILQRILEYQSAGSLLFGMPYAEPFASLSFFHFRIWSLSIMVFFFLMYYAKRMDTFDTILVIYVTTIAVTGLAPQYLMWIVPLLLITRHFKACALYSAIAVPFLFLYYMNPWFIVEAYDNINTLVVLKSVEWLMPSSTYSTLEYLPVVKMLGNYLLPLFGTAFALYLMIPKLKMLNAREKIGERFDGMTQKLTSLVGCWYHWAIIVIAAIVILAPFLVTHENMQAVLTGRVAEKILSYAVKPADVTPAPSIGYVGDYPSAVGFDVLYLYLGVTLIWSFLAVIISRMCKATDKG